MIIATLAIVGAHFLIMTPAFRTGDRRIGRALPRERRCRQTRSVLFRQHRVAHRWDTEIGGRCGVALHKPHRPPSLPIAGSNRLL